MFQGGNSLVEVIQQVPPPKRRTAACRFRSAQRSVDCGRGRRPCCLGKFLDWFSFRVSVIIRDIVHPLIDF